MPIYQLNENLAFPPVEGAEDGIVAVGGDLSPERLMLAYHSGIFPWFSEGDPIIWWSPDPRFVLFTEKVKISRTMRRILNQDRFEVTFNQDFEGVINACKAIKREGQDGTWITDNMRDSYIQLHEQGEAQSVEVWQGRKLVGGMYGVEVGRVFSGESMFSKVSNASKVGLVTFMKEFEERGGLMLDCQVRSEHLASLGAESIAREEFLEYLN